jgi:hypothetical protein
MEVLHGKDHTGFRTSSGCFGIGWLHRHRQSASDRADSGVDRAGAGLVFGFLAISDNESRRKLFMHINVTIALLGFLGGLVEAIRGYVARPSAGIAPDQIALASKLTLAGLLFIYVILCVRSFIAARRSGKV